MLNPKEVGYFALELLHHWPVVRKPSTIQNLVDSLEKSLPVSQVGAAHMKLSRGIHLADECRPPEPFFSKKIFAVKHVDLTVSIKYMRVSHHYRIPAALRDLQTGVGIVSVPG
jgi:hypothetical protein